MYYYLTCIIITCIIIFDILHVLLLHVLLLTCIIITCIIWCDKDFFVEAFESAEKTVEAYKAASQSAPRSAAGGYGATMASPPHADPYSVLTLKGGEFWFW